MKTLRWVGALLFGRPPSIRPPRPQATAFPSAPVAVDMRGAARDPGPAGKWLLGLALVAMAIGTSAAVAWRATPPASLDEGAQAAPSPGTIKPSPTRTLAFDGSTGMIAVHRSALQKLRRGDFVFARYGAATLAFRVDKRERRADHLFVGLVGVDPVTGRSTASHASYHLYADAVSHALDSPEIAFEVYGRIGTDIGFVNTHRSLSRAERRIAPARAHAAH
jgi:hypothetical protein